MIITKRVLPRRTVLRGLGAAVALPLLDGMVPALSALGRTAARPVTRLGVVYVPNGIVMDQWTPATDGAGFDMPAILRPLERFRDQLTVVSGLSNKGPDDIHETGATSFLTGVPPKRTQGASLGAGVSMDQVAARETGRHTQLASLELALESGDDVGTCGGGYTCAYTTPSAGGARRRRCRWRPTRARSSSVCWATPAARIRRPGWPASSRTAACSTR